MRPFVRCHPAEEEAEVASVVPPTVTEGERGGVEAVMDHAGDGDVGRGPVLGVGDADDGHAGCEHPVEVGELVVEGPVDRGHDRKVGVALGVEGTHDGVVMDDVELRDRLIGVHDVAQLGHGHADAHPLGVLQGPRPRHRAGRIPGGEQHQVLARGHQAPGHLVHHELDPPVQRRGDRRPWGGDQRDPHGPDSSTSSARSDAPETPAGAAP